MAKVVVKSTPRPKPRPVAPTKKNKPMVQYKTVSSFRFKKGGSHIGP